VGAVAEATTVFVDAARQRLEVVGEAVNRLADLDP
jgi:hypothetical protein